MAHPEVGRLIDFARPVGLILVAVLHFLDDADEPYGAVRTLTDALQSGSHLVVSHAHDRPDVGEGAELYRQANMAGHPRSREDIAAFFEGFDLLDPGVVSVDQWRPETTLADLVDVPVLGGVGYRPGRTCYRM